MLTGLISRQPKISATLLRYGIALIGLVGLSFIVYTPYIPRDISLNVGEVAQETITSPRYISFETEKDKQKTADLRAQRAKLVEPIYSIDESINKEIQENVIKFFTVVNQIRAIEDPVEQSNLIRPFSFLSARSKRLFLRVSKKDFASIEYSTIENIRSTLSSGVQTVDKVAIRSKTLANIKVLGLGSIAERAIIEIILHYIQPNMVFDDAKTQAQIQKEQEAVKPFTTVYEEGQPIVYRGKRVTEDNIEALKALNLYGLKANVVKYFGILLFSCLLFLLLERFTYYFSPKIWEQNRYFMLMYVAVVIVVILARMIQQAPPIKHAGSLEFLIPVAIVSMIVSVLVTRNVSLLVGTITSVFICFMFQADFYLFLYLFFSTCITTFASRSLFKRYDLIKAGYIVGLSNIVLVVSVGFLKEVTDPWWYGTNGLIGFGNGILAAMISFALIPYFENLFKITTSQWLLEHSNLTHPLLKRLMMNAPGTYQHSLMVATLAESAAEAIGADMVLCRIGAYFHDIGKLKRPSFFTENQFSGENPHDNLSPRISKMIISSHTKDGVEMAQKHKLPKILQDFMLEHHGTSLVSYFYTQALHSEDKSEISEEEFRYSGPKPQTKEAGILMLADSVEASVRSMDKPTIKKIDSLVDRIFQDRIIDHQLDDCPLSLSEITTIKETFLTILNGIQHSRINYQEELQSIIQQRQNQASEVDANED